MKLTRTLSAFVTAFAVAAAFAGAATAEPSTATKVVHNVVTKTHAPQMQVKIGRQQFRKGVQVLRFLRNHPTAGPTYRIRVRIRKNHEWLVKVGRKNMEIGQTRLDAIAAKKRAAFIASQIGDVNAWLCIHSGEGAWNSNTGNGYYGGLQMDMSFQRAYGPELLAAKGTANNWTPYEQMMVAERARRSGRGYYPWPTTARTCGLI